ncbi:hypothetical protein ACFSUK_30595 [Sphingobium scionense]
MDIQLAEVLNHKSMAIFVDEKVAAIAANISSRRRRYGTAACHAKIGYVRAARDVCCRTKHQQTLPLARDVRNRDRREPILMAKNGRFQTILPCKGSSRETRVSLELAEGQTEGLSIA